MSLTDRAFIAAYTRQETPAAPPVGGAKPSGVAAPHFQAKSSEKRPLSSLIGQRSRGVPRPHATAKPSEKAQPFEAGVELTAFPWPPVVRAIAQQARAELLGAINAVGRDHPTRPIVLVGTRPGVGLTTTTLAIALAAAHATREVAIIDACHDTALARRLGFTTLPTLSQSGSAADPLRGRSVRSQRDATLLAVAGARMPAETAERIAAHQEARLTLIDAGPARPDRSAGASPVRWTAWSGIASFVLVDSPAVKNAKQRGLAIEALCSAGVTPLGVIETPDAISLEANPSA